LRSVDTKLAAADVALLALLGISQKVIAKEAHRELLVLQRNNVSIHDHAWFDRELGDGENGAARVARFQYLAREDGLAKLALHFRFHAMQLQVGLHGDFVRLQVAIALPTRQKLAANLFMLLNFA